MYIELERMEDLESLEGEYCQIEVMEHLRCCLRDLGVHSHV